MAKETFSFEEAVAPAKVFSFEEALGEPAAANASATEPEVVTSARPWQGAGAGRGGLNDPRRLDVARPNVTGSVLDGVNLGRPTVDYEANLDAMQKSASPGSVMFSPGRTKQAVDKQIELGELARRAGYESIPDYVRAQEDSERRQQFAEDNPNIGALASGMATVTKGTLNAIPAAAGFVNKTLVDPFLGIAGARMSDVPTAPGTSALDSMAKDFMPAVGKLKLADAWDGGVFKEWLAANVSAQVPQIAQSVYGVVNPAAVGAILPMMGAQAAGGSFAEGDDPRVAVSKGIVEMLSEGASFGVAEKVKTVLQGLPSAARQSVLRNVAQKALAVGGALTAQQLAGAVEESVAQLGGNALDIYASGKQKSMLDGVPEAAVIGAAVNTAMALPNVAEAARSNRPEDQAARELARELERGNLPPGAVETLNPNLSQPAITPKTLAGLTEIGAAASVDEAIIAAARATTTQAQAVDNIGRLLGDSANVSQPGNIPPVDSGAAGAGAPEPGIRVEAGVGASGAAGPALDAGGVRDQPAGGAAPLAAGRDAELTPDIAETTRQIQELERAPESKPGQETRGEPASVWFGRRGDGYQTPEDAQSALPTRTRISPELDWRVEQMPTGRYRLAGYDTETRAPTFTVRMNPTGTATVLGNPKAIAAKLAEAGITKVLPNRDGVTVATSQAQAAAQFLGGGEAAASTDIAPAAIKPIAQGNQPEPPEGGFTKASFSQPRPAAGPAQVEGAGVVGEFADLFDEQLRPKFPNAQSVKDFKKRTGIGQDGVRAIQAAVQEGRTITVDEARQIDIAAQERRNADIERSKAESEAESQMAKEKAAKPAGQKTLLGEYEIPGIEGATNRVRVFQMGERIEAVGLDEGTANNDLSGLIQAGQNIEQALAALYGDHGPNEAPDPSRVKRAGQPGAVETAGVGKFDSLEDALTKEKNATTSEIENAWMEGAGRRRRTPIEEAVYDAVTAAVLDADLAAAIVETALKEGRPDLALYAAKRAARAADSMSTTPGVSEGSPKYESIKKNLVESKQKEQAAARQLLEKATKGAAPATAPKTGDTITIDGKPAEVVGQTIGGVKVQVEGEDAPRVVPKKAAKADAGTDTAPAAAPEQMGTFGRDLTPIAQGGKPFKTKAQADAFRKANTNNMRTVKQGAGFVLRDLTAKELAAREKAAKRLAQASTSPAGVPIPAHAFIADKGGLAQSAMADSGFDRNMKVGNRWLFAGADKPGLTLAEAAELLAEAGYIREESESAAADIIKRSITNPQYTAEGWERIAEAEQATRFEDHLAAQQEAATEEDPFGPAPAFTPAEVMVVPKSVREEYAALMAAAEDAGIDTESVLEEAARIGENWTQEQYSEHVRQTLTDAIANSRREADRGESAVQGREDAERSGTESSSSNTGRPGDAPSEADEGLTAPTQQEVLDQQQRREQADDLDQREQIQREASGFQLQAQAPEQRRDNTGDMFGGPTAEDVARARKPGKQQEDDGTAPLFSRGRIDDATRAENLKRWSNNAPYVSSAAADTYDFKTGQKVMVEAYHGTARPDRVGTVFQRKRATSGPMAFFTSAPDLASSYAQGKQDTSITDDERIYAQWFKYKPPGQRSAVDIVRAWNFLDNETKARIAALAPRIKTDNATGEQIELGPEGTTNGIGNYEWELEQTQRAYDRRGNPLKALLEGWLNGGVLFNEEERFLRVLELAGFPVKDVTYDAPNATYPFVYKAYIAMQKPLVTGDVPQAVIDALKEAAKRDRSRAQIGGADMWDKNTRTLREWVANYTDPANDSASYVWTSIPDKVTDVLKSMGYDGIIDWSGKGGGDRHPVYIPFEETQVKSAIGNKGTFDPLKKDILFARAWRSDLRDKLAEAKMESSREEGWRMFIQGLTSKGVKPDEIEWSGVTDWLKLQTGKVTKQQVLDYLDANGVQVEEVVLGAKDTAPRFFEWLKLQGYTESTASALDADKKAELTAQYERDYPVPRGTRYSQYTLPGGENYREVLLTLPTGAPSFRSAIQKAEAAGDTEGAVILRRAEMMAKERGVDFSQNNNLQNLLNGARQPSSNDPVPNGDNRSFLSFESVSRAKGYLGGGDARYKSSHWDTPNVLAHIRLNDRVDSDGARVLFVEELQSDWNADGRKKGFRQQYGTKVPAITAKVLTGREFVAERSMPEAAAKAWIQGRNDIRRDLGDPPVSLDDTFTVIYEDGLPVIVRDGARNADADAATHRKRYEAMVAEGRRRFDADQASKAPRAPFVESTDKWLTLALKRVITMAAQEGYDKVAFVNGEQSADRYDLSKQVKSIDYQRNPSDGTFKVAVMGLDGQGMIWSKPRATLQEIEDTVGKEIAQKMERNEGQDLGIREVNYDRRLSGNGLKVGGEGMKAFYNTIVPNTLKTVLKKVGGGQVEQVSLPAPGGTGRRMPPRRNFMTGEMDDGYAIADEPPVMQPGFTITPEMREKASQGLPLFRKGADQTTGLTPTQFTQALSEAFGAKVADRLQAKGVVVPLADQTKLPAHVVPFLRAGDIVFGFYDPRTNRTYAVLKNLTPDMVKGLAMHEVGVHYGFEAMLGGDKYKQVMKQLDLMRRSGNVAVQKAHAEAVANAARPSQVPEETLAYLVQEAPNNSVIKDVIARIKAWLFREFGIGGKYLTERDLHMLARAAVQHAARTEPGGVEVPAFMRQNEGMANPEKNGASAEELDDALDALVRNDLEDDQVFTKPLPKTDDDSLTYVTKLGGYKGIHVSVRGGALTDTGPREVFFHNDDDKPIGFARLTKNDKRATISMIAFNEDARGNGYAKAFYRYLLDEIGVAVRSDSEITEGTAALYRSLLRDYSGKVDADGRVTILPNTGAPEFSRTPQTETKAFKDWFGDSVVTESGEEGGSPKVVYHGTKADFTEFKRTKGGEFGPAIYMTDSPREASEYGDGQGWGGPSGTRIMPLYASIKNPYTKGVDAFWKEFGTGSTDAEGVAAAKAAGYDGIIAKRADRYYDNEAREFVDRGAELTHYIAFNPEQVKSATGNRGTFDPKDPDIRFSRTNTAQTDEADPTPPELSPWRDATGRLQFAPGAWLAAKYGDTGKGAIAGAVTGAMTAGPVGAVVGAAVGAGIGAKLSQLQLKAPTPELRRIMRQMKLDVAKAQEVAAAVAGEATKLTEDERAMVSDLIEKELKAGTIPPEHAVRLAAMINSSMEQQTEELVRLGMLTKDSADRWRGQYLPRYYESKLTEKAGDLWADAMRSITRRPSAMKGIKGKHLRGRGLYETIPESQLEDYKTMGWEVRDPDYQPGVTTDGTVQVWRDFTRQERDKMGEIRDAGFRFVMGYMQTQKDIALGKMFEQLAIDPEMSSRLETEKFSVRVPDGKAPGTEVKTYGKLAGRYVTPETLSQLSLIEESQSEALMMYRKALGIWKEGKTVLNPVSHVNNTISNMSMAHFAGVSYGRADKYLAAMRDFARKDSMILEAKDNGLFLGTLSEAELMNTLPEDLKALAQKQEGTAEKVGRTTFNLMTFYLRRPMGWAYQAEDTFFRYLIYKDARGRGMEPQDAVDYAQRYIFTYDDLPKTARRIRDFGIPFFAYTYKAVPALLHTALTHPERLAAPAAVLWTINAAAYAIAAGDDEDDWDVKLRRYLTDPEYREKARAKEKLERELLPEWNKGTTSLMTPKVIRLGNDELTKLPLFIDVSRIIPGGDLFDVNPNAGGIGLPQPFTPSHPLFTTAVAMLANKDLFFGKDLTDSNDTAGEKFDKRAAWMWKQLTPAIAVNNYHWERGMNALAQASGGEVKYVPDFLGGDSTGIGRDGLPVQPKLAAMQTFGIKVRPYDLDAAESIQESAKQKLIRDIDTELRKLRRLENKGAVSDRTAEKERELANLKKDRLRDGKTVDGEDR